MRSGCETVLMNLITLKDKLNHKPTDHDLIKKIDLIIALIIKCCKYIDIQ